MASLLDFLEPDEPSLALTLGHCKCLLSKLNSPFAVLSLNIGSLRSNFNNLVSLLHVLNFPFSLIFISETRMTDNEHLAYPLRGYRSISVPRNQNGGGNILFYLEDLACNFLPSISGVHSSFESLFISLTLHNEQFIFGNIYRPPGKSLSEFNIDFPRIVLNKLPNKNVYISGDFNVNLLDQCNNNNLNFCMNLSEKNLSPRITNPTRVCTTAVSSTASLIDHVWDSLPFQSKSGVIAFPVSDHFPVLSVLNVTKPNHKCKMTVRRVNASRKKAYIERFDHFIDEFFRSGSFSDPEFPLECLMSHLTENIDTSFPKRNLSIKRLSMNSPWITTELLQLIHKKHVLFRKYRENVIPFQKFRQYRNMLNKTLKLAHKLYLRNKFNNLSKDQKSTWRLINKCLDNTKSGTTYPTEILHENATVYNDKCIANLFANFEKNLVPSLLSTAPPAVTHYDMPFYQKSAFLDPITTSEILAIISQLKKDSIHTADFPVEFIQLIAPQIALFLTRAFNRCLDCGVFPTCLKSAILTPRHKKGPKKLVENYRLISNLNIFSKIYEKLIYSRLIKFFTERNLLSESQFGFLQNKGIEKAALSLLYDIYHAKMDNLSSLAVFIDYSKAFNTIDHEILVNKLFRYGIRGLALDLLKSFLAPRTYRVRIRTSLSDPFTVDSVGTPQGSSLSPLLFIIYINDLVAHINKCRILLYADDIVIYNSNADSNLLRSEVQTELDLIDSYSTANKLFINSNKTECMFFKNNHNLPDVSLTIRNGNLKFVPQFTYLGLTLDINLSFKAHVLNVTKKLNSVNRILYSLNGRLPFYILRKIFFSIGYPHIHMHIIAWGGANLSTLWVPSKNCTEQNKSNIKYNSPFSLIHTDEAYKELNVLPIPKLFKFRLAIFLFSSVYGNNYILQDFTSVYYFEHTYNTRKISLFRMPRCLSKYQAFFLYQSFKLWPAIPDDIKRLNLFSFKREFRTFLMEHDI